MAKPKIVNLGNKMMIKCEHIFPFCFMCAEYISVILKSCAENVLDWQQLPIYSSQRIAIIE